MKCEVCGEDYIRATACYSEFKCAVCGKVMCGACLRILPQGVYLCPAHYSQVREYIEGLKPKVAVKHYSYGYEIRTAGGLSYFMPEGNANALYSYMRAERRDPEYCRPAHTKAEVEHGHIG